MDIKQLEVFVKVFENKSFSKAADDLGLSQPTVSAHIQNLEEFLGKRLFDRVGRKVIPTLEAKVLYRHAVDILKKRDEALSDLLSLEKEFTGVVRVAASNIPGDYLFPHVIKKLKEKFPKITFLVEIFDSNKVLEILKEQLPNYDVGFVGVEVKDPKFEVKKIHDDEIVLIAPPYFNKDSVELSSLKEIPLIFREEDSGTRKTVEGALKKAGVDSRSLTIVSYLGSNTAIKEAVKKGAGFGLVSKCSIKDEVECGKIKVVKVKGLEIKRCFYAVKRKDITPVPAVRELWKQIDKIFKNKNGEC